MGSGAGGRGDHLSSGGLDEHILRAHNLLRPWQAAERAALRNGIGGGGYGKGEGGYGKGDGNFAGGAHTYHQRLARSLYFSCHSTLNL